MITIIEAWVLPGYGDQGMSEFAQRDLNRAGVEGEQFKTSRQAMERVKRAANWLYVGAKLRFASGELIIKNSH